MPSQRLQAFIFGAPLVAFPLIGAYGLLQMSAPLFIVLLLPLFIPGVLLVGWAIHPRYDSEGRIRLL